MVTQRRLKYSYNNSRIMLTMNSEIEGISANMELSSDASKQLSTSLGESAENIASFARQVNEIYDMTRMQIMHSLHLIQLRRIVIWRLNQ